MITDKSAPLRVLVATAVLQCVSEWDWSISSFAAKAGEVEAVIRAIGTDSNVDARKIARQIFDQYKQLFPDRLDSFLDPLTPVIKRYLDIKPKSSRDEGGPAPKKSAPVPAPRFKAAPAPAPVSAPLAQPALEQPPEQQPRPKVTRVGQAKSGPSRAPVSHPHAFSAPGHSRIVSGPERIQTHPNREVPEVTIASGPMRAALPSTHPAPPVMRSVSSSGPSRMRVDASAPLPVTSAPADTQPSSYPGPPPEPARRFRPVRAPMDPSQMPQRVAVPPVAPKPFAEPKKVDGPSRVNIGAATRSVSGPVIAQPTRSISASTKADPELKTSTTTQALSASASGSEAQNVATSIVTPVQDAVLSDETANDAPLTSPTSAPIPASAPASRPASTIPPESRPPSAMSISTSRTQPQVASASLETPGIPAPPTKPALTTSKSAPITTKVSALIKRGNPYAPPPFVPKRVVSGGVGAATASQMARQREAIAARETRERKEAEEVAKKTRKEAPPKKDAAKQTESKDKAPRPRPASSQSNSTRSVPAAPRKRTGAKPPAVPRKVDIKEIEPELVPAVCAPLPRSPTPPENKEAQQHCVPDAENEVDTETPEIEDAAIEEPLAADANMESAAIEAVTIGSEEPFAPIHNTDKPVPVQPTHSVIEISDDEEMDESESANTAMVQHEETMVVEHSAQTPQRAVQVSLIDQTPATTTPVVPPTGFAFHPHLAQFMALPPQPVQEAEDFLVDLSSPPPKERPNEKEIHNRPALGEMGNNHPYLSQFTQDLMTLSGL